MSKIEWTGKTWNPVTGCTKISEGCRNCYAAEIANRFWGSRPFSDVQFHPERLDTPLQWRSPRTIFVNSMSDLFHSDVGDQEILEIWQVMKATPRHTYQILTKRPEQMLSFVSQLPDPLQLLPNVWLGVTVENQSTADQRIPILQQVSAMVRFLSCEPLLESVQLDLSKIDWVIVGGESGSRARPCQINWIENVVEQCQFSQVPLFVKQLGGRRGKRGDPEKWPEHIRVREFPDVLK